MGITIQSSATRSPNRTANCMHCLTSIPARTPRLEQTVSDGTKSWSWVCHPDCADMATAIWSEVYAGTGYTYPLCLENPGTLDLYRTRFPAAVTRIEAAQASGKVPPEDLAILR